MKKLFAIILCLAMVLSITACGSQSSSAGSSASGAGSSAGSAATGLENLDPVKLILYTPSAAEGVPARTIAKYAELVSEASGGKLTLEVHDSNELGNDAEGIESTRMGTIDIIYAGTTGFTSFYERAKVLDLPFLFDSSDEAYEAMNVGGVGDEIFNGFEDYDLVYLGTGDNGMRQISTTNRPINTADDVVGLKLRVPTSQMYLDVWEALGATPISLALNELAVALSNGTAEGQDNATYHLVANATYDDIKYFSYINYMWMGITMAINKTSWEKLAPEYQEILKEKATEACKYNFDIIKDDNATAEKTLIDAGVEFNYEPDVQSFKDKLGGNSYYERYSSETWFDQSLLDQILAYGG